MTHKFNFLFKDSETNLPLSGVPKYLINPNRLHRLVTFLVFACTFIRPVNAGTGYTDLRLGSDLEIGALTGCICNVITEDRIRVNLETHPAPSALSPVHLNPILDVRIVPHTGDLTKCHSAHLPDRQPPDTTSNLPSQSPNLVSNPNGAYSPEALTGSKAKQPLWKAVKFIAELWTLACLLILLWTTFLQKHLEKQYSKLFQDILAWKISNPASQLYNPTHKDLKRRLLERVDKTHDLNTDEGLDEMEKCLPEEDETDVKLDKPHRIG